MFKNKKDLFNIGLLVIFIWLLITSYSSSKRKPENIGELFADYSWLSDWPKWLDLPLMPWINKWFKALNENYGFIFEAINNFLLAMLMGLKNFLVQAPWPLVILGVIIASKKSRQGTGYLIALGFAFAFAFIISFVMSRAFAENGSINPLLAVWLPNIIFGLITIYIYRIIPK